MDANLEDYLCLVAEALDWSTPPAPGRGRALGISASDAGSEPVTTSLVRVQADGSLNESGIKRRRTQRPERRQESTAGASRPAMAPDRATESRLRRKGMV